MHIRVADGEEHDGIIRPLRCRRCETFQGDKKWQHIDLEEHSGDDTAVDSLADEGRGEQSDDTKNACGNREEVGLNGRESEVLQREGHVLLWRTGGDWRIASDGEKRQRCVWASIHGPTGLTEK